MIGRTHGIHAEPITFGWKLAGWAFELDRTRARVARALEENRVGQLSGTVGTYAQLEPEVERIACEQLGLEPDPLSTQVIARDRHAALLGALALAATSLERFALEIRHLARTEVREVEEPFGKGMKGSSAMPHKRNPKVAERICGLARVVRAAAVVGFENVPLWHERDISHSSAERVVIPDAFLASTTCSTVSAGSSRASSSIPSACAAISRRATASSSATAASCADRVGHGARRGLPTRPGSRHARLGGGAEFEELVRSDSTISGRVDLDAVFDLDSTVRHVDAVFERLRDLEPKEAPVHV